MDIAVRVAEMSHDKRHKVGCVIVKDGQIISQGWNGMPSGMPNQTRDKDGKTLPEVIHSEANALMKMAKHGGNCKDATIYCTYSPCWGCAKLLLQAGIKRIVYKRTYDKEALEFLKGKIEYERIGTDKIISFGQAREGESE